MISSHFDLFGLPARFTIDAAALDDAYRRLQGQVHPDRFAGASDAERRLAMQRATQANEAYRVLRHPLERAKHLLELRGIDLKSETSTSRDAVFLGRQLEWREAIEDAREARNAEALEQLLNELDDEKRSRYTHLEQLLATAADQPAAEAARQLMFIEKLEQEIGDGLESLAEG
jgi:molecular chaperone HscB